MKKRRPVLEADAPHALANGMIERWLARRIRPSTATMAGFAALARNFALLGGIHRRKAALGTTTLRCCHHFSPWLIGGLATLFLHAGSQC